MRDRIRILEKLRKRRAAIAGAVLPLLATVWFGASASLCFAMAPDAPADAADAGHAGHRLADHGSADRHSPGSHAADHEAPQPEHGSCPHCPPSMSGHEGTAASHASCAALDDLAGSAGSKAPAEPQHSLPAPTFSGSFAATRAPPAPLGRSAADPAPPIPLNLRHCVFLI